MLKIQIDDPTLEKGLQQVYGSDTAGMARAFYQFAQQQQTQQDIRVSIQQLDAGEGIPLDRTIQEIRVKYE